VWFTPAVPEYENTPGAIGLEFLYNILQQIRQAEAKRYHRSGRRDLRVRLLHQLDHVHVQPLGQVMERNHFSGGGSANVSAERVGRRHREMRSLYSANDFFQTSQLALWLKRLV
jgi:hypothetical protein